MGELHLEVIVNRMLREYRVGANIGKLQVAFTETITRPGQGRGAAVRSADGWPWSVWPRLAGARAAATRERVRVRQQDRGWGNTEGIHPGGRGWCAGGAGERWARRASGWWTCGPHSTTGRTTRSIRRRSRFASPGPWRCGRQYATLPPIMLEPIMHVEVVVPESSLGDIIGDLSARRGRVEGLEAGAGHARCEGYGSAGHDVWVREYAALVDAGAWHVLHGVCALRTSA